MDMDFIMDFNLVIQNPGQACPTVIPVVVETFHPYNV